MAPTQDVLYRELDLNLSWSERDLPERERTKHVHRLHPYLGKFVPQLVEAMLERHLPGAKTVLDPFAGSGTTLVQSLESGRDATGVDVAAFNCLLMRVKTAEYNLFALENELRDSLRRLEDFEGIRPPRPNAYIDRWFAPQAAAELVFYRSLIDEYWCHKHRKTCRPVERAEHFLRRYALDTLARIRDFSRVRARDPGATVLQGDARGLDLGGPYDGVVTSPPYPGLIDYHEQHRYAYELLGLQDDREHELGAAERGTSAKAIADYVDGIAGVFANA